MLFAKNNFECLSISKAVSCERTNNVKPGMVITFDDGYANNFHIALPILMELEIPAIIYITTQNVLENNLFWSDIIWMAVKYTSPKTINLKSVSPYLGIYSLDGDLSHWYTEVLRLLEDIKMTPPNKRKDIAKEVGIKLGMDEMFWLDGQRHKENIFSPLTPKQISKLASCPLITLGAHSHCHNLLDQLSIVEAQSSIQKSKEILETMTGNSIEHFSYPNGNFNKRLQRLVREAGFISSVTYKPGFFHPGDNLYTVNRFGVGSNCTFDLLKAILTGVFLIKNIAHG
jgi:peptidoglycan/xylan/chitin deacetylase (PgdA/CDA1 family)